MKNRNGSQTVDPAIATNAALFVQPEPDFSYNMFDHHGLTELFVGAGGAQAPGASMQGDELQQVRRQPEKPSPTARTA